MIDFFKFSPLFELTRSGKFNPNVKYKYPELFNELNTILNFLEPSAPLSEKFWYIKNQTVQMKVCKFCENKCSWDNHKLAYSDWCSVKCANKDQKVLNKRNATNLKKYGSSNFVQTQLFKDKSKKTFKEKYGTEHSSQNDEVKQKTIKTNLEKYGVSSVLQSEEIKQKIEQTNLKKYGYKNVLQSESIRKQITETCVQKYGKGNNIQKTLKTIKTKYDKDHYSQIHIPQKTLDLLDNENWLIEQHIHNKFSLTEIAQNLNVSVSMVCSKFKHFNIDVNRYYSSREEQEIKDFLINELKIKNIVENSRNLINPYELDIYLPDHKLAIELNGIVWHSQDFGNKDRNYHAKKSKLCADLGIQLIHIFCTEWNSKREIVKSRLANILGRSSKVFARKCHIKQIDNKDAKDFLNKNHIQGYVPASFSFGLYYNNDLVAVQTFGKSRFNRKYEYELLRYCNKLNTSVIGGASKLLKYFIRNFNPKSIVSYSDIRWNSGKLYKNLGFNFVGTSNPNYFYFKINSPHKVLLSRQQFQKHKLKSILPIFDKSLSEWENMRNNGFDRIWDCGNIVWELQLN
jgi:predicted DNA-binding protein YlxM (UPF0122 family)